MTRPTDLLVLGLIAVYLVISVDGLSVVPSVGQDEPWIASAPYKLATEGVYGSDLFAGFNDNEHRHYQHMPVFLMLQALVFEVLGIGVFQMRLLPVMLGAAVLAGTYMIGRQVGGDVTGLLAVGFLMAVRIGTGGEQTGIPLLDLARINRYDLAVPAFGLPALLLFHRARTTPGRWRFVAVGVLTGIATLSHVYGLFWLVVFAGALTVWGDTWRPRIDATGALLLGFVLPLVPWAIYVAGGWDAYVGQMYYYTNRFDLLDPAFYVGNALEEIDRYRALDLRDPNGRPYLLRPGLWLTVVAFPLGLVYLIRGGAENPGNGKHIASAVIVHIVLFTLVIRVKAFNYVIAFWPLVAIVVAVWMHHVWHRFPTRSGRAALLVVAALVFGEGMGRVVHRHRAVRTTTPYSAFEDRVARLIPEGAVVLGLQHYWLGLRQHPFRTWMLPLFMSDPAFNRAPIPFRDALDFVDPDVVLMDELITSSFAEAADPASPYHYRVTAFQDFMQERGAALAGVVEDSTYGRMEVYVLRGNDPPAPDP